MAVRIGDLAPYVIILIVLAIALSIGARILIGLQTTQTADSVAWNATEQGLAGLENFTTWIPIMALVIAAAAVIGVVMYMFARG